MKRTVAELKRQLTVGRRLTMTAHSWYPNGGIIGVERRITRVYSTGIVIGNSHLAFPKASELLELDDKGFTLQFYADSEKPLTMSYIFNN